MKIQRKTYLLILSVFLCFSFTGCNNVSMSQYAEVEGKNAQLEAKIKDLEDQLQGRDKYIDELKNGAERRINEIRAKFQNKEYDAVMDLTKLLEGLHPGSKEAIEAKGMADEIARVKEEEKHLAEAEAERKRQLEQEEAERKKKEAEKSAIDKAREIIRVTNLKPGKPNSAGGVDLYITFQNKSQKEIKYAYFTVVPYNAVGDPVSCSIGSRSAATASVTGPIAAGQYYGNGRYWECLWYNNTITSVKLTKIEVTYMDGSSATIDANNANHVIY